MSDLVERFLSRKASAYIFMASLIIALRFDVVNVQEGMFIILFFIYIDVAGIYEVLEDV